MQVTKELCAHKTKPEAENSKSWRDVIKVHPAADLFPMMSDDELKALGEDIKKNGLRNPLALWIDPKNRMRYLIDGRNRADAMQLVNIDVIDGNDGFCHYKIVEGDPYAYVVSANLHRRHLTAEQKREVIEKLLTARPDKSDRQIAKQVKADHKTVGAVRAKLEDVGKIPHVAKRTDTKGRRQPTRKHRTAEGVVDAKARVKAIADRAEQTSQQTERSAKRMQHAAETVTLASPQTDIERVLPDAARLVSDIMARNAITPGYAEAVRRGLAARLSSSGYPDMPDFLKRKTAATTVSA